MALLLFKPIEVNQRLASAPQLLSPAKVGMVLGAQDSIVDKNHPEEVYAGRSDLGSLEVMLSALNVAVYPEDRITAFPQPELKLGSVIRIKRAMPVTIIDNDQETVKRTWVGTVKELLEAEKIDIGEKDLVAPDLAASLSYNLVVTITRVAETSVKVSINLPFKTITKDDPDLEEGKTRVVQAGSIGKQEKIFLVRRENGREVTRALLSDTVIKQPVDEIKAKGTKPRVRLLKAGQYKDIINEAAQKYGAPAEGLYKIMICESNGHANSIGGGGTYFGLFQFTRGAWSRTPYAGSDILDPYAQINAAASQWGKRKSLWANCAKGT